MRKGKADILWRWIPAFIIMIIIYWLSSIPSQEIPSFGTIDLIIKKGGHMIGYALLALANLRGIGANQPHRRWLAWAITVAYAMTDEFHQSFVPGRGASLIDVGVDALGAAIALSLESLFAKF